jgi:acetate kinase
LALGRIGMNVASFNLGSSSLKCSVHEVTSSQPKCLFTSTYTNRSPARSAPTCTIEAIAHIRARGISIDAVGHRFVFGGEFDRTTPVTDVLIRRLEALQSLDPLHAPQSLSVLRTSMECLPDVPEIACFDTTFFRDLPVAARTIPIPISDPLFHRYGFHGLSYEHAVTTLGDALRGRTIIAHLGSGSSLAAFNDGKPVDTTMGFSSLGGVMMESRAGDLDPGALLYLLERCELTVEELRDMLERRSGLRALAGGEGDVQILSDRALNGDPQAAFALECYTRSIAKAAGALIATLGGLDTIVFTGGVGEHQADIRADVIGSLCYVGAAIDEALNSECAPVISGPASKVSARVIRADENLVIARNVAHCMAEK